MVFNQFHGAIPKGKACHQLPRGLVKSFGKQSQFIIVIFIVRSHHPLAEPIGWLEAHRHGSNFFCMAKFFRLRINLQSGLRSLSVSSDFLEPPDYESLTEIAAKAPANASHWNLVASVFVNEMENLFFGRSFSIKSAATNDLTTRSFHPQPPDELHRNPTTVAILEILPTLPMASRWV